MITRVYEDGSSRSEIHQIYKILDKKAVEELSRWPMPGRIQTLKILEPDGTVLEPLDAEGRRVFNLPGLDAGSLLVSRQTLFEAADAGAPIRLGRFFLQDSRGLSPFLFSRYVVAVPKGLELVLEKTLPEAFEEERIEEDRATVHVFTARHVPVVEPENMMPPEEEAFPNVLLYQRSDWTRVSQRLANGHFPSLMPSEELRKKAEEITAGMEGCMDKARAVYAFVNDHVKEDRGSSDATQVLLEGQGDRLSLFMALIKAAGLSCELYHCGFRPGYLSEPEDWSDVTETLLPNKLVRIFPPDGAPVSLSLTKRPERVTPAMRPSKVALMRSAMLYRVSLGPTTNSEPLMDAVPSRLRAVVGLA